MQGIWTKGEGGEGKEGMRGKEMEKSKNWNKEAPLSKLKRERGILLNRSKIGGRYKMVPLNVAGLTNLIKWKSCKVFENVEG